MVKDFEKPDFTAEAQWQFERTIGLMILSGQLDKETVEDLDTNMLMVFFGAGWDRHREVSEEERKRVGADSPG